MTALSRASKAASCAITRKAKTTRAPDFWEIPYVNLQHWHPKTSTPCSKAEPFDWLVIKSLKGYCR